MDTPRYWFSAKRYWGGRLPLTWEGWLVDVVWIITFVCFAPYAQERRHPFQTFGLMFGLIVFFLSIRRWKGEPRG
jgi:hypothetical protein